MTLFSLITFSTLPFSTAALNGIVMRRISGQDIDSTLIASRQCDREGRNFGTNMTPQTCLAEALKHPDECAPMVMFSESHNEVWGCRCCAADDSGHNSHGLWDIHVAGGACLCSDGTSLEGDVCFANDCSTCNGLIELSGGNDGSATNLKACTGECDSDEQCAPGLKCYQRSNGEPIPGCKGSGAGEDWDYCYDPNLLPPATELSGGNDDNASNLRACTGECDSDAQCAPGLKCFQRSHGESIPGCKGSGSGPDWDYCYDPNLVSRVNSRLSGAAQCTDEWLPVDEIATRILDTTFTEVERGCTGAEKYSQKSIDAAVQLTDLMRDRYEGFMEALNNEDLRNRAVNALKQCPPGTEPQCASLVRTTLQNVLLFTDGNADRVFEKGSWKQRLFDELRVFLVDAEFLNDNSLEQTFRFMSQIPERLMKEGLTAGAGDAITATLRGALNCETHIFQVTERAFNTFDLQVGDATEDAFGVEVTFTGDLYMTALRHETAHQYDRVRHGDPVLRARYDDLFGATTAAGNDDNWMRLGTGANEFFSQAPQEIYASLMGNQYTMATTTQLEMALIRLEKQGLYLPLAWFLHTVELFSGGGDTSVFYLEDPPRSGRITSEVVKLERNSEGRIISIERSASSETHLFGFAERQIGDRTLSVPVAHKIAGGPAATPGQDNGKILLAYWDNGFCGPEGDDHNWGFCGQTARQCPQEITTSECASRAATLVSFRENVFLDGCSYVYYAEYRCVPEYTVVGTGICVSGFTHGEPSGSEADCRAKCESEADCGFYCYDTQIGTPNGQWDCFRYSECTAFTQELKGESVDSYRCREKPTEGTVGDVTCGGIADGASCQFPFTYEGVVYNECTSVDHDQPWCFTTEPGKWGNCNCETEIPDVPFGPLSCGGFACASYYDNIGGVAVRDLTNAANFPNNPNEVSVLTSLSTSEGRGDDYGVMVEAWIQAPTTGDYVFSTRSDDASEVYVMPQPEVVGTVREMVLVVELASCCRTETGTVTISMTAGRSYFLRGFMKEGGGQDYFEIGFVNTNTGENTFPIGPAQIASDQRRLETIPPATEAAPKASILQRLLAGEH